MEDWRFFHGHGEQIKEKEKEKEKFQNLKTPPWRRFGKKEDVPNDDGRWEKLLKLAQEKDRNKRRGEIFRISPDATDVINAVNAAIYLRRPLLVTGKPGSGKTSLAYAIAYELNLGPVLSWGITARSTLQEGLYRYDAIARLQDAQQKEEQDIGKYITLGALGTAFLPSLLPRVFLIDEIDKSDINLPNDLLNIFEEGEFQIPELVRRAKSQEEGNDSLTAQRIPNLTNRKDTKDTKEEENKIGNLTSGKEYENNHENNQEKRTFKVDTQDQDIDVDIVGGWVRCYAFPIIVMTSNGERDFPPAFKRRCVRVEMPEPKEEALKAIVKAHFKDEESLAQDAEAKIDELIKEFLSDNKSDKNQNVERATDQLLNTIYLLTRDVSPQAADEKSIKDILLRSLNQ